MEFKVYPITEIEKVKKIKRQIQLSRLGIVLSHFGEIKGFLISIPEYQKLIDSLPEEEPLAILVSLNEFIHVLKKSKTKPHLLNVLNIDSINLTFNTREIMAFVNAKYQNYLPINQLKENHVEFT